MMEPGLPTLSLSYSGSWIPLMRVKMPCCKSCYVGYEVLNKTRIDEHIRYMKTMKKRDPATSFPPNSVLGAGETIDNHYLKLMENFLEHHPTVTDNYGRKHCYNHCIYLDYDPDSSNDEWPEHDDGMSTFSVSDEEIEL